MERFELTRTEKVLMCGGIILGAAGMLVGGSVAVAGIAVQTAEQISTVQSGSLEVSGLTLNNSMLITVGGSALALTGALTYLKGIESYVRSGH